jgi:hypothetical protein
MRSLVFATGVLTGTTSLQVGNLPPGAYIEQIVVQNTTANAGGEMSFGTASGGGQIVAAAAGTTLGVSFPTNGAFVANAFSSTAQTPVWITSTAWGSANATVTVIFGYW